VEPWTRRASVIGVKRGPSMAPRGPKPRSGWPVPLFPAQSGNILIKPRAAWRFWNARRAMIGWIMPRKGTVERREVDNDPVFANQMVQKLINCLTYDGKRAVSQGIVYDSFELIRQRANDDPLKIFKKAVENIRPALEVKSRRVGGANYQVPVEVNRNRQGSLSLRWLISYARQRSEKSMVEKLAAEMMDAANNKGGAIKKRDDTHRMAEANKAFAHYRW